MNTNYYYSCVVDSSPFYYYQTWNLVNSLISVGEVGTSEIFVHYVEGVDETFLKELARLGANLIPIKRFGDGKYCNKIAQLYTPQFQSAKCIFLLDADMIVLGKITDLYTEKMIAGKIVDLANPDISVLKQIFDVAGFKDYPEICAVDCEDKQTFSNNLNGGLYVIPGDYVADLRDQWSHWALWLLNNIDLLKCVKKENHVDQVSFSLATHALSFPIKQIHRKYNYPVHLPIHKSGYPTVLHYHRKISKVGLIETDDLCDHDFKLAIQDANRIIADSFNNRIFWSFRYNMFPELGSGVGSRGDNLEYKRTILKQLGVEESPSILDVGCGDIEVIKALGLNNYTGIDISVNALNIARQKRPDLNFILITGVDDLEIPSADTVLCLEVLIHQKTAEEYYSIIQLLANKTRKKLIVSGYTDKEPHHDSNHMLMYHESLPDSLRKTGRFSKISQVGSHSDVAIFMAEV